MGDTLISWTQGPDGSPGKTWNFGRGCRRTAPENSTQSGCGDASGGGCYAERTAARFCGPGQPYEGLIKLTANGPRWSGAVKFVTEHLTDPLRTTKPKRWFVDSMSDLFYEGFSDDEIAAGFGVMAMARQHTFMVLTKRAERMVDWFDKHTKLSILHCVQRAVDAIGRDAFRAFEKKVPQYLEGFPLPNVWMGVSTENQAAANQRIPLLLQVPAEVRFLSVEPLLGPVTLKQWLGRSKVGWVIAGCESGPKSRSADPAWFESLRDECQETKVSYFFKQARASASIVAGEGSRVKPDGVIENPYLSGRQYMEFPDEVHF